MDKAVLVEAGMEDSARGGQSKRGCSPARGDSAGDGEVAVEVPSAGGRSVLGSDGSGGRWRVFREGVSRGKGAFALEAWPSKPLKRMYNIRRSLNGGRSKLGRPCTYTLYTTNSTTPKEP
jgi:hypothetical protein